MQTDECSVIIPHTMYQIRTSTQYFRYNTLLPGSLPRTVPQRYQGVKIMYSIVHGINLVPHDIDVQNVNYHL